jgi:hypothetical protein
MTDDQCRDLLAQGGDIRDQAVEGLGLKAPLKLDDPRVQFDQLLLGMGRRALRLGRTDGSVGPRRELAEGGAEAGRIMADLASEAGQIVADLNFRMRAKRPPGRFRACGNHCALLAHSGSISLSMSVRIVNGDSSRILNP